MDASDYSESIGAENELKSEMISQGASNNLSKDNSSNASIFALTLDEIQNRSGMSFGMMNMDELLNTVSNDEFQLSSNVEPEPQNNDVHEDGVPQRPLSVPTPLSGKTVDEVWAEIQVNSQTEENQGGFEFGRTIERNEIAQLQTLGEMTLEEFLVAAGVIPPPSPSLPMQDQYFDLNTNPSGGGFFNNGPGLSTGVSVVPVMGCEFSTHGSFVNGNVFSNLMSDGSSAFNMGKEVSYTMSVDEERKYKRMIKNRASAARSRARKQAYTAELEKELSQHKAINASLKLALEAAKKKIKEEAEKKFKKKGGEKDSEMKGNFGPLRRTKSASLFKKW